MWSNLTQIFQIGWNHQLDIHIYYYVIHTCQSLVSCDQDFNESTVYTQLSNKTPINSQASSEKILRELDGM